MSPDMFLVLLLSYTIKQVQVSQMNREVKEVTASEKVIIAQLNALEKIPMTQAILVEIKRLVDPWVEFIQALLMGSELTENDVKERGLEMLRYDHIKPLIDLDVEQLQKEWTQLNLINRLKVCNEELEEIMAALINSEASNNL